MRIDSSVSSLAAASGRTAATAAGAEAAEPPAALLEAQPPTAPAFCEANPRNRFVKGRATPRASEKAPNSFPVSAEFIPCYCGENVPVPLAEIPCYAPPSRRMRRMTALKVALRDAITIEGSTPTPWSVRPSASWIST
jgi:hypothetical protein